MDIRGWAWSVALVCVAGLTVLVVGCESGGNSGGRSARPGHAAGLGEGIDQRRLRSDLTKYADLFSAVVSGTMSQIAAETKDRRVREYAFLVRGRQVPHVRGALLYEDPREALLRVWADVVYMEYWAMSGRSQGLLGPHLKLVQDSSRILMDSLLKIARSYIPEDVVQETQARLEETVKTLPPSNEGPQTEIVDAAEGSGGGPFSILTLPLQPLTGVSDTADSLAQIAVVAQAAVQVMKEMPTIVRWQAEMLLFEIDDMETLVVLRDESKRLAAQIESLSETAEALPERVREETEVLLDRADGTAERLARAMEDARGVTEEVNTALVQAERVTDSLKTASGALTETSDAVTRTVAEARGGIADLNELGEAWDLGGDGGGEGVDLEEVAALAESLERAVVEARGLLADVGQPLGPDSGVSQAMDRATAELRGVMNGLLWRGVVLIGVAFVAALAFRFVTGGRRKAAA